MEGTEEINTSEIRGEGGCSGCLCASERLDQSKMVRKLNIHASLEA